MTQGEFERTFKKYVDRLTRYMRVYLGQIVNETDPDGKNRKKVTLIEFDRLTEETAVWAWHTGHGDFINLKEGDWVRVGFMNAQGERPYIMGMATEMEGMTAKQSTSERIDTLYAMDADTGLVFDKDSKVLSFEGMKLEIGDATEQSVKGTTFDSAFQALITWMGAHIHTVAAVPGPSTAPTIGPPSVSGYLSDNVKLF